MNTPLHSNSTTPVSPQNGNSMTRTVPRLSGVRSPDVFVDSNSLNHLIPATSTTGTSRKPLHQSSPTLRTTPCFPPSAVASRSNPTMSSFKGMSRTRGNCSPHQHNASFLRHNEHRTLLSNPRSATGKQGVHRCAMVGLDKIVQRSSSKSVKQTLARLEDLGQDCHHIPQATAPYKELDMLLELSTDVYYRVVMKKCRGLSIISTLQQHFPELHESCEQLLKALDNPAESGPSPRSTRTTVLLDSSKPPPSIEPMDMDDDNSTRRRSTSSEDIAHIINEGCQKILW